MKTNTLNKLKVIALLLVAFLFVGMTTVKADDDETEPTQADIQATILDEKDNETDDEIDITLTTPGGEIDDTDITGIDATYKEVDIDELVEEVKEDLQDYIDNTEDPDQDIIDAGEGYIDFIEQFDAAAEVEITDIPIKTEFTTGKTVIEVTIESPSDEYAFAVFYPNLDTVDDMPVAANIDGKFTFNLILEASDVDTEVDGTKTLDIDGLILFKKATNNIELDETIVVPDGKGGYKTTKGKIKITTPKGVSILYGYDIKMLFDWFDYNLEEGYEELPEGYDAGAYLYGSLIMNSNKSTKIKVEIPIPEGYSNATPKMAIWNSDKNDYDEYDPIDYYPGYAVFEIPTIYPGFAPTTMSARSLATTDTLWHTIYATIYFQYGDNQQNKGDKDETPHTGDFTTIYAIVLATVSLAGIVIINRKK